MWLLACPGIWVICVCPGIWILNLIVKILWKHCNMFCSWPCSDSSLPPWVKVTAQVTQINSDWKDFSRVAPSLKLEDYFCQMLLYLGINFLGGANLFLQRKFLHSATVQHFVRIPELGLKLFTPSVLIQRTVWCLLRKIILTFPPV